MPLMKKTPKSERGEDGAKRGIGGRYSKKEPLSPQVAGTCCIMICSRSSLGFN